jgi:hypothetical protein
VEAGGDPQGKSGREVGEKWVRSGYGLAFKAAVPFYKLSHFPAKSETKSSNRRRELRGSQKERDVLLLVVSAFSYSCSVYIYICT